ncbi:DUF4838 domain-containing protein [candidate division KSB1 bacterium]|nr:DUF4838 domain-containing protein [candidate division KSB1 bacterium]
MKHIYPVLSIIIIALCLNCTEKGQPIKLIGPGLQSAIVLDLGHFSNPEAAMSSINDVNWDDENFADDNLHRNILAALELQHYMTKIFNIPKSELPVVDDDNLPAGTIIFIGSPEEKPGLLQVRKKLEKRWKKVKSQSAQGFRLDTFSFKDSQDFLVLSGKSSLGTLYAVYELLDRWGVRWISPGDSSEIVPSRGGMILPPMNEYFEPDMEVRGFVRETVNNSLNVNNLLSPEFLQWMARNRLNYIWQTDAYLQMQKQYGIITNCGEQDQSELPLNPKARYPYNHQDFTGDEELPADVYRPSSEYSGDINHDNILSYLEAHPEWYDLTKSKLTETEDMRLVAGICVTNNDFLSELNKGILGNLESGKWKNAHHYILRKSDNTGWCSCEECSRLGNQANKFLYLLNRIQLFMNHSAQGSTQSRMIRIAGLTDSTTIKPPTHKLPHDFDYENIRIILTPVERCYNHSIIDPNCTEVNQHIMQLLKSWTDKSCYYKGKIYLSELYNNRQFRDLPVVFTNVINKDIPFYFETGINGLCYTNARISNAGVHAMINYQFARQSWRSQVDVDSLKIEYITTLYPGQYDLMKEYYNKLEKAMANISAWKFELVERINKIMMKTLNEPLMPLKKFKQHYSLESTNYQQNNATNWEMTYQLVYELRYILQEALAGNISDKTKGRLIDLYYQLLYAELTINLFDNVIRFMTLGNEEPEMKTESLLRLASITSELQKYEVTYSVIGNTNGLDASGIKEAVDQIITQNRNIIDKYKTSLNEKDQLKIY